MVIKANIQKNPALGVSLKQGGGYVTNENIIKALGYTPANEADIPTKVSQLENDEKYVKSWEELPDKPFYIEDAISSVTETLFEHEIIDSASVPLSGVFYRYNFAENLNLNIEENAKYTLIVNGVEYEVSEIDTHNKTLSFTNVQIGSLSTTLSIIQTASKTQIAYRVGNYGTYTLDVSLYSNEKTQIVHPLPEMFLPVHSHEWYDLPLTDDGKIPATYLGESELSGAFDMVSSNTITWNGDASGKVIVNNLINSSFYYVKVSSTIPTLEDFQKGGSWASVDADGVEYDELFVDGENITENDTLIDFLGGYILIVKENNAHYVTNIADCTFPETGVYFAGFTEGGYISKLTITDFTQFTKPILRKESLPDQYKDWYGVVVNNGNTAVGDAIVHGGFVKVSNSVPTEAELQAGGTIRYYNVENGEITGDLITANYLESPYVIVARDEGILITYDGIPIVVISINGSPNIGPFVYDVITSPGVYFNQSSYTCIHSLTINGYTGFEANYSKVPMEFIPDGIGGASSWNDLTDKPFGERTISGETITWDGNADGLHSVMGMLYHVSEYVPTLEQLQLGGTLVFDTPDGSVSFEFTAENIMDGVAVVMGTDIVIIQTDALPVMVALTDNATITGDGETLAVEKAGVYFPYVVEEGSTMYISSLTVKDYSVFKQLESEYLEPFEVVKGTDTLVYDYDATVISGGVAYIDPNTPSKSALIGATISHTVAGYTGTATLTEDNVAQQDGYLAVSVSIPTVENGAVTLGVDLIIVGEDKDINGNAVKKGINMINANINQMMGATELRLTIPGFGKFGEGVMLKEEYLPERLAKDSPLLVVNLSNKTEEDGVTFYDVDVPYIDILNAIFGGYDVFAKLGFSTGYFVKLTEAEWPVFRFEDFNVAYSGNNLTFSANPTPTYIAVRETDKAIVIKNATA